MYDSGLTMIAAALKLNSACFKQGRRGTALPSTAQNNVVSGYAEKVRDFSMNRSFAEAARKCLKRSVWMRGRSRSYEKSVLLCVISWLVME